MLHGMTSSRAALALYRPRSPSHCTVFFTQSMGPAAGRQLSLVVHRLPTVVFDQQHREMQQTCGKGPHHRWALQHPVSAAGL